MTAFFSAIPPERKWPHDSRYFGKCAHRGENYMGPKRSPCCWSCADAGLRDWWLSKHTNEPREHFEAREQARQDAQSVTAEFAPRIAEKMAPLSDDSAALRARVAELEEALREARERMSLMSAAKRYGDDVDGDLPALNEMIGCIDAGLTATPSAWEARVRAEEHAAPDQEG